jgi:hypothetical protein
LEALAVGKVAVEVTGAALVAQVEIMVGGDKEVVDLDSDPVAADPEVGGLEVADLGEGALEVVEDLAVGVETGAVAASLL